MLNEETRRKLRELGIPSAIDYLTLQYKDPDSIHLSFEERFQGMVDYMYQEKYNTTVQRLIKLAKFRLPSAQINNIYYGSRGLDKNLLAELSTLQFMRTSTNLIFQGLTGSGKTFLSCAIGVEACKAQYRTQYIRLPDLLVQYDESTLLPMGPRKLLKKYAKYELLIIDEWLLDRMSSEELNFIFELVELRLDSVSTIFCTQFTRADWHDRLGGGVRADAIMDRIVHNAIWIDTGTKNMREFTAKQRLEI